MDRFPDAISIGEKYEPAMRIVDQAEADAYFEWLVEHSMRFGKTREEAERIERINLGYYAGYYGADAMVRVNRLFRTEYPIFGVTVPSPTEAFIAGRAFTVGYTMGKKGGG